VNSRSPILAALFVFAGAAVCSGQSVARVLLDEGWRSFQSRRWSEAAELLQQAIDESTATRHERDMTESRAKLAWVKFEMGQTAAAATLAAAALKHDSSTTDAARAEVILANTASSAKSSLAHLERAKHIFEQSGDEADLASTQLAMAERHLELGNYETAYNESRNAAASIDRQSDLNVRARRLLVTASAALALDRLAPANRALEGIQTLLGSDKIGSDKSSELGFEVRQHCLCALADGKLEQGNPDSAFALLARARDEITRQQPTNNVLYAPIVLQQAQVRIAQGKLDAALASCNWLTSLGRKANERLLAEAFSTQIGRASCRERV